MNCETCPYLTDCGFTYVNGIPFCKMETEGGVITTETTDISDITNVMPVNLDIEPPKNWRSGLWMLNK